MPLQPQDGVTVVDDAVAVGDENHRAAGEGFGETAEEKVLGGAVEGGTELIKKKDAAGTQEGAGNGDALGLPFGETAALLEARGVEPGGEVEDKVRGGNVKSLCHTLLGGVRVAHLEILADGAAEEGIALRDIDEVAAGGLGGKEPFGGGIDDDRAGCRGEEREHKADERALPYSGRPDDGGPGAGREIKGQA